MNIRRIIGHIRYYPMHICEMCDDVRRSVLSLWFFGTFNYVSWACMQLGYETNELFELRDKWNKFVRFTLLSYGWNNRSITNFIEWGVDGHNNDKLWHNPDISVNELMEKARGDMFYCSDRMTLDRLFRINWIMNNAIQNQCREDDVSIYKVLKLK